MTRLRVLHVAEPTDYGVATCVADLAADQVAHGWEVTVLSPPDGRLAAAVHAAGARHRQWDGRRSAAAVPRDVRAVRAACTAERPDVVHLHSSRAGIAGRLALRAHTPTLFQPHAWSFFAARQPMARALVGFERFAARWASVIVCCSNEERVAAVERGLDARFVVVPNAVDLDRFPGELDRSAARSRLGLGSGPIAVCVARISRQKGQRDLITAWPLVRAALPDAELVLVGDGPERAELEGLAVPGVRFVGHQDDVRPWLAASDVVTILSRYEGLSLAVLEAMAAARSLVVTAAQGMAEVVRGGGDVAGAIVPVGDVRAAADAIVERLRDPALTRSEGERGRALAEANHDKTRWLTTMREVTAGVLAEA